MLGVNGILRRFFSLNRSIPLKACRWVLLYTYLHIASRLRLEIVNLLLLSILMWIPIVKISKEMFRAIYYIDAYHLLANCHCHLGYSNAVKTKDITIGLMYAISTYQLAHWVV